MASLSYSVEIKGVELSDPIKVDRPRLEISRLTLTTQKQTDRKMLLNIKLEIDKVDESEEQVNNLHEKFTIWIEQLVEEFVLTFSYRLNFIGNICREGGTIRDASGKQISNCNSRIQLHHRNSRIVAFHNDSEEVKNYLYKLGDFSKDTPSWQREIASKMLRTSLSVDDAVVSYLLLYNTLVVVVEYQKNNTSQKTIDSFITSELDMSVQRFQSPRNSNVQETIFTKLRNDIHHAHDRSANGFDWSKTAEDAQSQLGELRKLVAYAIQNYT